MVKTDLTCRQKIIGVLEEAERFMTNEEIRIKIFSKYNEFNQNNTICKDLNQLKKEGRVITRAIKNSRCAEYKLLY